MDETIVLLHGSANGSFSWRPIERALTAGGARVVAPDMLGYGSAPLPSAAWSVDEEVAHLERALAVAGPRLHVVAHSLGAFFALHLRRRLGARVTRLTLVDPVVVSVLAQTGERAAYAEMESIYQRFHGLDGAAAARGFVEHWSGAGAWDAIGDKARAVITSLVPRLRLETTAARDDRTPLAELTAAAPPTTILVGERTLLAPRAVSRQLARALGALTVVVAGAGHMIPLTHPAAVLEAVTGAARAVASA